jgi:catechol 2,3-dioxygenase-like lactoylglutathione lyase family enzyme
MILTLQHMSLPMPAGREEQAEAFYTGVLGLPRISKPLPMGDKGCWFVLPDGRHIHLVSLEEFAPLGQPHPAFVVDSFGEAEARIVGAGFSWEPCPRWPGMSRAFTSDPFGNRIEIMGPEAMDLLPRG